VMMMVVMVVRRRLMMVVMARRWRPMATPRRRQLPSGLPLGCLLGVLDVAVAGLGDEFLR
jgi:hypothetical protein